MKNRIQANWEKSTPFQKGCILLTPIYFGVVAVAFLPGFIDRGTRAIRRGIGGESFVVYQCSRAQGRLGAREVAKNLGVSYSEVGSFCQFYTNKIQNIH